MNYFKYLNDGIYIKYDGDNIILFNNLRNKIILSPETLTKLIIYIEEVRNDID